MIQLKPQIRMTSTLFAPQPIYKMPRRKHLKKHHYETKTYSLKSFLHRCKMKTNLKKKNTYKGKLQTHIGHVPTPQNQLPRYPLKT